MSKEEALATVVVTAVGGSSLPALSLVESVSSFDCSGSFICFGVVKLFLILGRIRLRTLLFRKKAAIELGSHLALKLKSE